MEEGREGKGMQEKGYSGSSILENKQQRLKKGMLTRVKHNNNNSEQQKRKEKERERPGPRLSPSLYKRSSRSFGMWIPTSRRRYEGGREGGREGGIGCCEARVNQHLEGGKEGGRKW